MSVQRYPTADGTRWRVRWREDDGRMRSKSLPSRREAQAFDADLRARRYRGEALPKLSRDTLASAYEDWWRLRGSQLSPNTQRSHRAVWNAHVRDRFDHHKLSSLASDPQLFEELSADMRDRGVGPAAHRRTLMVISAVLSACVDWKKIAANPVLSVPKPPSGRQRRPRPFPPLLVEQIRQEMRSRPTLDDGARGIGDACLVSVLSYAGLRPGEALALTWADIATRTIAVDKAIAEGEERTTKTGRTRSVPLTPPLAEDLAEWRELRGSPSSTALVFAAAGGAHWSRSDFGNWRNRVWRPALRHLADADPALAWLATARPYDCRGSFVSLHLRAGASPLEVAAWAGHSPAVMFSHYAGVIQELVGEPTLSAEEQIERARKAIEMGGTEITEMTVELIEEPYGASGTTAWKVLFGPKDTLA